MSHWELRYAITGKQVDAMIDAFLDWLQSVSWSLAEFRHNKIVQSPDENYFNVCRQHKEKWDLVKMTIIQTGW